MYTLILGDRALISRIGKLLSEKLGIPAIKIPADQTLPEKGILLGIAMTIGMALDLGAKVSCVLVLESTGYTDSQVRLIAEYYEERVYRIPCNNETDNSIATLCMAALNVMPAILTTT